MGASIVDNDSQRRKRRNARRRRTFSSQLHRFDAILPRFLLVPAAERPKLSFSWLRLPRLRFPAWYLYWGWLLVFLFVAGLAYGIYFVHTDDRWFVYREDVSFENLGYLDQETLYEMAAMDSWNVLWLRKEAVRQRLRQHPFVVDAQINIEWPAHVTVRMMPAKPVALWITGQGTYWLMPNGYARPIIGTPDETLPQLFDPMQEALIMSKEEAQRIEPQVLTSVLALLKQLPSVGIIRYTKDIGLNFNLTDIHYYVYWGDGYNFDQKLNSLEGGKQLIGDGKAWGTVIDVRGLERPFIR